MADSLDYSGSSSNPMFGLDSSDYAGYGSGGNQTSDTSGSGWGTAGALGLGALGFGSILAKGESPLPQQYRQLEGQVPGLQQKSETLFGEGQQLYGQGTNALGMAQRGELTDPQKAQLGQFRTGLENKSRQMFASMGRNPDQDTAAISQQANDDAQVNAMAQEQIRTTIQLGLGELSAGGNFSGQSAQFSSAANNILLEAGKAQLAQDKAYSDSLTSAFSSIGKMFGMVAGGAVGGPAGAAAGGAAGGGLGSLFG